MQAVRKCVRNATLFSEGSSNATESDGSVSAGRMAGPVFLPKTGAHTLGVQGWGTYLLIFFIIFF